MRLFAALLLTLVTAVPALAADVPSSGMGGSCGTVTAIARFISSRTLACGLLKDDGTNVTAPSSAIKILGGTSGGVQLAVPAVAGSNTVTFPAATDTLVGKATTDTLTNKTFNTAGTGNTLQVNGVTVSDNTGTGKVVRDTSPTIVTPTIASLANANHSHGDAAGGGTLNASAIAAGVLATARLGSGTANVDVNLRGDQTWASPLWNYQGTSRISVSSTSQLTITVGTIPLKVGGIWTMRAITSAITTGCTNSGLTAATLYRVYAFDNSGTTTCEISATARATDTTYGVEIKSGDATRTLVGMVYMGAGSPGTFVDSAAKRFTISWFNRRALHAQAKLTTDRTTTSTSGTNELNTEIRVEFITWPEEAVMATLAASGYNDTAGQYIANSIAFDGTSEEARIASSAAGPSGYESSLTTGVSKSGLSEGYHYATMLAFVSANTGLWRGGAARTTLSLLIRG